MSTAPVETITLGSIASAPDRHSLSAITSRRTTGTEIDLLEALSSSVASSGDLLSNGLSETNTATHLDGGYGWIITLCSFILVFQYLGVLYSFGVIQAQLAETLTVSSLSLSLIGAASALSLGGGCVFASRVLAKLGPKRTSGIGVIGASLGLLCSGWSLENLGGLVFLQGILFGLSGSLIFLTAYTIPSTWFLKKRGLATGVASCGAGLGGAVWSIGIERLIRGVGLAWTYRYLAIIQFVTGIAATLPLRYGLPPQKPTQSSHSTRGIFRSSRYIRMMLACFVASYPFFIPPYYIPQYAKSIGFTAAQGALYSAVFNVASGFGRVAFGVLADNASGNLNAWTFALLILALSSLLVWPYAMSEGVIIFFVVLCGSGSGGFFTLQSPIVSQILGDSQLHIGVALLELSEGLGSFAGPISAGALLDAFGGVERGAEAYRPAMYLVGATSLLSCLIAITIRYSSSKSLFTRV